MNKPAPELIKCALCGEPGVARAFDHALQGPVGRCCHEDLQNAASALCDAKFEAVTHDPDHEK